MKYFYEYVLMAVMMICALAGAFALGELVNGL